MSSETNRDLPSSNSGKLIGEYLRQLRESKEISLHQISERTRINLTILKELENSNILALPDKTYVRGFIKSYAKQIGADVDDALTCLEKSYEQLDPDRRAGHMSSGEDQSLLRRGFKEIKREQKEKIGRPEKSKEASSAKFISNLVVAPVIFICVIAVPFFFLFKSYEKSYGTHKHPEPAKSTPPIAAPKVVEKPAEVPGQAKEVKDAKPISLATEDHGNLKSSTPPTGQALLPVPVVDLGKGPAAPYSAPEGESNKGIKSAAEGGLPAQKAVEDVKASDKTGPMEQIQKTGPASTSLETTGGDLKSVEAGKVDDKEKEQGARSKDDKLYKNTVIVEGEEGKEKIQFEKMTRPAYKIVKGAPEADDASIFPEDMKKARIKKMENIYIKALDGDSWITYKKDDSPVKSFVLKKDQQLLLQGKRIRILMGNIHASRIFYNNNLISVPPSSSVKSLVFPPPTQESGVDFPLFIHHKNGKVFTSEEYQSLQENFHANGGISQENKPAGAATESH